MLLYPNSANEYKIIHYLTKFDKNQALATSLPIKSVSFKSHFLSKLQKLS